MAGRRANFTEAAAAMEYASMCVRGAYQVRRAKSINQPVTGGYPNLLMPRTSN
jgi:hypothetical protein